MSLAVFHQESRQIMNKLNGLSNDELDSLLNSDEKIEEILKENELSFIHDMQQQKDNLLESNERMSESNLTKEPELTEGRQKILELSEEGETLSKSIEEKMKIIRDKNGDLSLETALALLQTAASEMEEESENIAKKFMDEGGELEDFLDQFLTKRKLMHLRLIKAEKMSKVLQNGLPLNNTSTYINTPPLNINSRYFPGVPNFPQPSSLPYPTGPLNMPMPSQNVNFFQNHF